METSAPSSVSASLPRYRVDPDCPVCDCLPRPEEALVCRTCTRPHHLACWVGHGGCAEPGCVATEALVPVLGTGDPPAPVLEREAELRLALALAFSAWVGTMYAAFLFLPPGPREETVQGLGLGLLVLVLALATGWRLVRVRFRFDPATRTVAREVLAGPRPVTTAARWLPFGDLRALELRRWPGSRLPGGGLPGVEAWLRHPTGAELVLREEALAPRSPGLAALREAARLTGAPLTVGPPSGPG